MNIEYLCINDGLDYVYKMAVCVVDTDMYVYVQKYLRIQN